MLQLKFTNKASDSIKRAVQHVSNSAPDDLEKAIDFVKDLGDSFEHLQKNPKVGVPCDFTTFPDTRFTHLRRYNGFMVLYTVQDDSVLIIEILSSWMSV